MGRVKGSSRETVSQDQSITTKHSVCQEHVDARRRDIRSCNMLSKRYLEDGLQIMRNCLKNRMEESIKKLIKKITQI